MSTLTTPPPTAPPSPPTSGTNGLGVAALVLGVVALVLGLIPFVGFGTWVVGVVGVVLGFVGLLRRDRKRGVAVAGLIASALAIIVGLAVSISAVIGIAGAVSQAVKEDQPGRIAVGSTEAPKADAVASFYKDSYGSFPTKTFKGTGDDVVTLPKGAKAGIVVGSYSGSGNFSVAPQDSDNKSTGELLVNTIGEYKGTTAWGLGALGNAKTFKVSADGKWKLVLRPIDSAKALPKKGSGDGVYKYAGGAATWAITHRGEANFVVAEYSSSPLPNLAVNEIGKYKGKVPADAGPAVVVVQADGTWTIK